MLHDTFPVVYNINLILSRFWRNLRVDKFLTAWFISGIDFQKSRIRWQYFKLLKTLKIFWLNYFFYSHWNLIPSKLYWILGYKVFMKAQVKDLCSNLLALSSVCLRTNDNFFCLMYGYGLWKYNWISIIKKYSLKKTYFKWNKIP